MYKLDLEKAEEQEIKLPTSAGSWKKQESSRKTSIFFFIDYAKAFDCVDHKKLWKIPREMEYQTTSSASWEICMQVRKQQLELDMEQWTGSKLGKEYIKVIYCHLTYLTYMQNTAYERLKLESRLPGEISTTSYIQMIPLYGRKQREKL